MRKYGLWLGLIIVMALTTMAYPADRVVVCEEAYSEG